MAQHPNRNIHLKNINMTAKYEFYKNPVSPEKPGEDRYHARIVPECTVETEWIARKIQYRCTASTADVKGVLEALKEVVVEELTEGRRVHIDGLGYLSMTLKCPPLDRNDQIRAETIRFKSVAFRPEAALKEKLSGTRFERSDRKAYSRTLSPEETDDLLTRYFALYPTLSRRDFQQLCGCVQATARRRLHTLVGEGKLRNIGLRHFPVYEAMPGKLGRAADGRHFDGTLTTP